MKKAMIHIALVLALSFSLCGCGNAKEKNDLVDNPVPTTLPSPTVTVTPMITPDVDNGVVTDGDGVIDDKTVKTDEKDGVLKDTDIATADAVPADSSKK